jgi:hypothetical protein
MRERIISLVERYVGQGRPSGDGQLSLRCPFHKGGQESHPSFSINVDKAIYHCFTCHESGTIIKLLKMLGVPPDVIDLETKGIADAIRENHRRRIIEKKSEWVTDPFRAQTPLAEAVLKPYHWCPSKLVELGFCPYLLQQMEIGFDKHNNRITYPVRDIYGNLAGIVGGATYSGWYPKYKVYENDHKDSRGNMIESDFGPWFHEQYPDYTFRNHDYLWNFERVYPSLFFGKEVQTLIVAEGFKATLWLLQHNYPYVVALMGSSMSEKQEQHLQRLQVKVVLFLDDDPAGQEGSIKIGWKLQRYMTHGVFIAKYPDAKVELQPDDLSSTELFLAISGAIPYSSYVKGKQI